MNETIQILFKKIKVYQSRLNLMNVCIYVFMHTYVANSSIVLCMNVWECVYVQGIG